MTARFDYLKIEGTDSYKDAQALTHVHNIQSDSEELKKYVRPTPSELPVVEPTLIKLLL